MNQPSAGSGANEAKVNDGLGAADPAAMLSRIIGKGWGTTSIAQGLESAGLGAATIFKFMEKLNTNGGFLAKLLHDIFVKNFHSITDFTGGISGSASDVSMASLGDLSPQTFASGAPAIGEGMNIG